MMLFCHMVLVNTQFFTSYLAQHDIIHRVTCLHTSEHNDIFERKHRHVVEVLLPVLMTVQSSQVGVPISSVHISWI
ncbi:hypothetical protein ES332_D10G089800v1 [Gossypium tomentosum]|uniref:Uncharacterized protein n=1 Tax=Gossypium tomentosum TaxID=34277 RepID=A0A5D2J3A9_GOSTO|nr:hypothetical protein ES332_D10G089800v1 [Gossypium tomentosum]